MIPPDYLLVVKYVNRLRKKYREETEFIFGYEAVCLGYSLYKSLTNCGLKGVILAPTSMAVTPVSGEKKTDKRYAKNIARCLRNHTYSAVHIPTEEDDQVNEYIEG